MDRKSKIMDRRHVLPAVNGGGVSSHAGITCTSGCAHGYNKKKSPVGMTPLNAVYAA